MIRVTLFALIVFSGLCNGQQNLNYQVLNLDTIFNENKGTFVLYNLNNNNYRIYNYDRAQEEFAVHSTSKIVWSIIALEENLVKDEQDVIRWDSIKYPKQIGWPEGWAEDQTVVSALNKSVNWYYIELMKRMTPGMVEKYLNLLDYQKGFKVEKVHYFGLTFNIRKSVLEQIDFLKRLYKNDLNISETTLKTIKRGLLFQKSDNYTMYAKKGLGPIHNGNAIGWLIGYIEKGGEVYFFALNVENEDELKAADLRVNISMRIFKALNII